RQSNEADSQDLACGGVGVGVCRRRGGGRPARGDARGGTRRGRRRRGVPDRPGLLHAQPGPGTTARGPGRLRRARTPAPAPPAGRPGASLLHARVGVEQVLLAAELVGGQPLEGRHHVVGRAVLAGGVYDFVVLRRELYALQKAQPVLRRLSLMQAVHDVLLCCAGVLTTPSSPRNKCAGPGAVHRLLHFLTARPACRFGKRSPRWGSNSTAPGATSTRRLSPAPGRAGRTAGRSSSSRSTTPRTRTTTAAWRPRACSRAGPCPSSPPSTRPRSAWPSASRTTRWGTPPSRAPSPPGSTAPATSASGTTAPTTPCRPARRPRRP